MATQQRAEPAERRIATWSSARRFAQPLEGLKRMRPFWQRGAITTCLVFFTFGCGYFQSGTWEDDPRNWNRAFHSTKPGDVVVLHSKYWRSPHWSYEVGYAFEIQANVAFRNQLFRKNHLVKLERADAFDLKQLCFTECPKWFAPKPIDFYDMWTYAPEARGNFRVLIDKATGDIFITDYQV